MLLEATGPTDPAAEEVPDEDPADERPRLVMPTSLIVRASCGPVPVTRSPRGRSQTPSKA
jgi:LacI family transcriptional regulator